MRQGENIYFLHFPDENIEAESYGSCGSLKFDPGLLARVVLWPRQEGPLFWHLSFRRLASGSPPTVSLPKDEQSTGPGHQSAGTPEFLVLRLLSVLCRLCMGFLTESVRSVDTTSGFCTWVPVVAFTVSMKRACAAGGPRAHSGGSSGI